MEDVFHGGGTPNFQILGQAYHKIGQVNAKEGQQPQFAQLWILDTDEATGKRLENKYLEENDREILKQLTEMIEMYHPAVKEVRQIGKNDIDQNEINLVPIVRPQDDYRTHNLPRVNEIAAVYEQNDDGLPNSRKFSIFQKEGDIEFIKDDDS
ncbi:MAG: hypothetical protein EZS28_045090 [Streblomastix strix]|uniref:Uncharacterized protein n=1 Tax=Streblomastix strix TaxID=222440 RepID=A0A5J4TNJ2_9EUKA|nr:MAG: hypothetical protein EZS28_045090 [Streblomastix strix]